MLVMPTAQKRMGRFFRQLREGRRLGLRQAAKLAKGRGLTGLTVNRLGALERGEVKAPKPDLLRQIATLYELRYETLAEQVAHARYAIDLPSHPSEVQTSGNEAASNRVSSPYASTEPSSPEDHPRGRTDPVSPEHLDAVIEELFSAAASMRECSDRIEQRITELGLQYPRPSLIDRQAAMARLQPPVHAQGARTDHRQPNGSRRRTRRTG